MKLPLPKLPCSGKLCKKGIDYHKPMHRFHPTCLYCRKRREYYTSYHKPSYWINYTYLSWWYLHTSQRIVLNGKEYTRADGGELTLYQSRTLRIDPRGHFTKLRCAIIIFIDRLMVHYPKKVYVNGKVAGCELRKPWAEICELLANYPT